MHYVIVGAGIAGTTAAEELQKRDPASEITLIGEEEHALYSRVLLPHYLLGKIPREKVFLKKEEWYSEHHIEYLRGERVVKLDTKNKHVELSSAREIPYDKLLLTTGGSPRMADVDGPGVSYLQTLDDADHLLALITKVRAEGKTEAAVYGGGFIACEYLNIFSHHGFSTKCFYRGPWFWSHAIGKEAGELVSNHLRERGVTLLSQTLLTGIHSDGELEGVETTSGVLSCTLLGIGIGLERDLSLWSSAGVETNVGIRTNAFLETSVPDVYAAGDVCEYEDEVTGRRALYGNWLNALMQGRTVASTMAGERKAFRLVSSYATHVLGLNVVFIGDARRDRAVKTASEGSAAEGGITELFYGEDDQLVGAVLIGTHVSKRAELTKKIQGC